MQLINPISLHQQLSDRDELALIDVRPQGIFGKSHILTACCVPQAVIEILLADLVPRFDTRLVITDGGERDDAIAVAAAKKIAGFGYTNVSLLHGGTEAWASAGFELFSGVNVPSKAFGEFVEATFDTPRISAQELTRRNQSGEDLVILDSRPKKEFENMSIPGGIDCPGAELAFRACVAAPDPSTTIVVNCAGRTRSIIGAQSLLNAGVPNPVVALENGTMGWHLAGFDVERGADRSVPRPTGNAHEEARQRAANVAKRYNIEHINDHDLSELVVKNERTVYLLDVRSPEEFAHGHRATARNAPGGQLVQATDEYIGVRNAVVVLMDDDGIRATMTASWLKQMGFADTVILDSTEPLNISGPSSPALLDFHPFQTISVNELRAVLDSGESCQVVDVGTSVEFLSGHIASSWWTTRSSLVTDFTFKPAPGLLVVTSGNGLLAHYVAPEIQAIKSESQVRVLEGGTSAWTMAGLPLSTDIEKDGPTEDTNDVFYKPYDHSESVERRMQEYLDWEVALADQVKRDGILDFLSYQPDSQPESMS